MTAARTRTDPADDGLRGRSSTAAFFAAVPAFAAFDGIGRPDVFRAIPDDWVIGLADVASSTAAIVEGRYKMVNTAGASVISAVSNALGTLDFPFLFAGDGASFAVAPEEAPAALEALAATVRWVGQELGLTLRAGTIGVGALRAQGYDVRVARFAASRDASYAMFSGGGLGWAEAALKAGALDVPAAPADRRPDLSGLSCRFRDLRSRHGVILSILVRPVDAVDPRFRALIGEVLAIAERGPDAGRPIPVFTGARGVAWRSIGLNARLARRAGEGRLASLVRSAAGAIMVSLLFAVRATIGSWSAERYLGEVVANTDFRKYDDGLMMTVDCAPEVADALESRLKAGGRAGIARFGLHRQASAMLTCVVPSALKANHVHFIDGAAGGYAMAARNLKSARPLASGEGL